MTTRKLGGILAAAVGIVLLFAIPAGAAAKDRNHDRIPDRWENAHHLSLKVKQTRKDQDRDGLRNRGEFLAGDKPHDEDTDGDGTEDGEENAGTIDSFQGGVLKINLFAGGSLEGQVTSDTEIECEDRDEPNADNNDGEHEKKSGDDRRARDDGSDGDGENSGPGSHGDNEGDENNEEGERDCSTADLTPDTVVHEAELEANGTGVVFDEIELVK